MKTIPRSEHPYPHFCRDTWQNLNGEWSFQIDDDHILGEEIVKGEKSLSGRILVPFCPESVLSGVGYTNFMTRVWYSRSFELDEIKGRTILHIGACDYITNVYVNGNHVGMHRGGYASFAFDITEYVQLGENTLVICADDDTRSDSSPSGKQSPKLESYGCHYTRTTGIWQTVWLEFVPTTYIKFAKYQPDVASKTLIADVECVAPIGNLTAVAYYDGREVGRAECTANNYNRLTISLSELHLWEVGNGRLYDLVLTLGDDVVKSYFGMRSVSLKNGMMYINDRPVFQRLVLDQGFYPDGIYTAPTDDELKGDVLRSMAMGFNGARLHEKIFEPRFLYHCDKLGYIVWGEHANWGLNIDGTNGYTDFIAEWVEAMRRDFNHPAIIGWCPLNETQENQNNEFVRDLMMITRTIDPLRPAIDGSGWQHVDDVCEIYDCHDYDQNPESFKANHDRLMNGECSVDARKKPAHYTFMSEFGGIGWDTHGNGWGYGVPKTLEEFYARFEGLCNALLDNTSFFGFCYTQLTDVEQEQNGLYTYDRKPKFDPARISAIVSRAAAFEKSE